jgi:hypothetical protein
VKLTAQRLEPQVIAEEDVFSTSPYSQRALTLGVARRGFAIAVLTHLDRCAQAHTTPGLIPLCPQPRVSFTRYYFVNTRELPVSIY